ncbi:MAG: glycosyltransferase [Leptospiraceae bacterium]|jgi:glycosyltransferase involved in cell wall biosynthesis|nr:glycosyltransferase [Leptospiraceae bacterium]
MNKTTKISIITINLNNKEGLRNTIESVMSQTFTDFELIVIDGDSTDGSQELINENSESISFWISEKDVGVYEAQNKGICAAKGKYCLFLNSGDIFYRNDALSRVNPYLSELEVYYCDVMLVYNQNHKEIKKHPEDNLLYFLSYEMICHQGIFFRTDILLRMNLFSLSYTYCSDYELLIRLVLDSKIKLKKVNEIVSEFDMQGMSNRMENGAKIQLEKKRIWSLLISDSINELIQKLHETKLDNSFWYHFRKMSNLFFKRG